ARRTRRNTEGVEKPWESGRDLRIVNGRGALLRAPEHREPRAAGSRDAKGGWTPWRPTSPLPQAGLAFPRPPCAGGRRGALLRRALSAKIGQCADPSPAPPRICGYVSS